MKVVDLGETNNFHVDHFLIWSLLDGAPSSAAGNPAEIAKLFPSLFGQPSASVVPTAADPSDLGGSLKISVVLSGGQAPGGHQGGFDMICSGRDKIETPKQFKQAEETALKLDLDGLVVIGGDDSNTNACLLAENFRSKNMKTRVIGCPKTIDGDLKSKEVPISFGFDTACKVTIFCTEEDLDIKRFFSAIAIVDLHV
ncbi:Pyrophosphate--fructose 6-phosphate 1-phosphotransferase subunit beta [Platanthera guangdongensis]|uniref:Pyrophosphate--fructose 6-phosphate 1-phosphotransferase subunit beta n=1 Tax=Platanthera guangdongensis TaxID=2320717 RepID=A0ABR2MVS9_9ASPA